MNFPFFEQLTTSEAAEWQREFLRLGRENLEGLCAAVSSDGVDADLTIGSIPGVVEWVASQSSIVHREPDPSVPDWIREHETYAANLFDFDESTWILVLRLAYYLGESFVRTFPELDWAVGAKGFAEQQQPVVTGFANRIELAVLLVSENMIRSFFNGDNGTERAEIAVGAWVDYRDPRAV